MDITQPNSAISSYPYYNIAFGDYWNPDLYCTNNLCSSYLGKSYQLPNFLSNNATKAQSFLAGSQYFQPFEIEIYLIDRK